jgi:hypothetical protein
MQKEIKMVEETTLPAIKEEVNTAPAGVTTSGFANSNAFDLLQRQAKMLAATTLVPKEYQGNVANCGIVIEMANRIGMSPFMAAQNLYIVHGKPSWSSQFVIAAVNSTGKFSPLRFEMSGEGDKTSCVAWAIDMQNGDRLESPPVSMAMAKSEGWSTKAGSKWLTMPQLMLRYRAATFFGRLYAPEILMGMHTTDENDDIGSTTTVSRATTRAQSTVARINGATLAAVVVDDTTGETFETA